MWKNMILDVRIKMAERNIERWKKENEITVDYIQKQKKSTEQRRNEINKQKELNQIRLEEMQRKQAEIEKMNEQIVYVEQENDALDEVLSALEEIDLEQVPNKWKGELRVAIEKKEVAAIKERFLTILRSHSLYDDRYDDEEEEETTPHHYE